MAREKPRQRNDGILSPGGTPFTRVDRKWSPYGTWGDVDGTDFGRTGRRRLLRFTRLYLAVALGFCVLVLAVGLLAQAL